MLKKIVTFPMLAAVRFYQLFISPLIGPSCRFHPSCSEYTRQAIEKHGVKGLYFSLVRILRCNPFGGSGVDEVPENSKNIKLNPKNIKFKELLKSGKRQ